MKYSIGVDLGATNIKIVAVDASGHVLAQIREATGDIGGGSQDPDTLPSWAGKVKSLVVQLESDGGASASSIGIAAPGLAARDNRSIVRMPGRLAGLEGFDWTDFLKRPEMVPVLNDAHAALVGEHWIGAAREFTEAILLTLGTGIGGALLIHGELYQGVRARAGHLGHITLDSSGPPDIIGIPGSLEEAFGECTLQLRSHGKYQSTRQLVEDYRSGKPDAASIWLESVRQLACAIAALINVLDPQAVIIGGGIARSGASLFDPLNCFLEQMEWCVAGDRVKLLAATLGDLSGAIGAARFAMKT
ncbi:MAG TPA: ROK family protein [Acidobacteriota bacterium]|nr:ROK family protein [Acidobacteriota bacterium]